MIQNWKMNALHDVATSLTAHTGLKTQPKGDDAVDITINNMRLGTLTADKNDPSLFMYTSADGYDVTGTYDDIEGAIQKDLDNQVEFVEITPDFFPPGTTFESVVKDKVKTPYLLEAILKSYKNYKQ